jgi:phage/plasmid-like protein (TIGR03299 family)
MITRYNDALEAFNLNWTVDTQPVYFKDPLGQFKQVHGHRAVVRQDEQTAIGVVGKRYKVIQNDAFGDILDGVLAETGGKYVKGGHFDDGGRTYLQVQLPGDVKLANGDASTKLLTFLNSHNGSSDAMLAFLNCRIYCQNTYRMALKEMAEIQDKVSIRHTRSSEYRIKAIPAIVRAQLGYYKAVEVKSEFLANTKFTDAMMANAIAQVLGKDIDSPDTHARTHNVADTILGNFHNHDGSGGTAWAAYNAFTHYTNHQRQVRGATDEKAKRFQGVLVGSAAMFNDRALAAIESQLGA